MKEYTLTKQISKQGKNALIVIPSFLRNEIEPKDIVEVKIKIIKKGENHD